MSLDPAEQFLHDLMDDTGALGRDLRDAALAKSKQGREERIERVREWLTEWRANNNYAHPVLHLTADDVMDACDALGLLEKDNRWTGSVLRGWSAVRNTGRYVPSRRSANHARPIPVWEWR